MAKVRVTLMGEDVEDLENVVSQIKVLADSLKMKFIGPVRLPRKKMTISCRRTPCGDGSDTYEHWEKRVSKRLIEVEGEDIKQILRVKVPTSVMVKISLADNN